jgi:hypothetical protein
MTSADPAKRPSIDEVVSTFDELWRGLDEKALRQRVEPSRSVHHVLRKRMYVKKGLSAVPGVES